MEGDAITALEIAPTHTVRIAVGDWSHDWPHGMVDVQPDAIVIREPLSGQPLVTYGYTAFEPIDDGWLFTGGLEDFTVTAGGAARPAMDTSHPDRQ